MHPFHSQNFGAGAIARLVDEGHELTEAAELAEAIIDAVVQRLVLIVPKKIEDVGFEVRSIQEFFAARAIVTGSDHMVLDRLQPNSGAGALAEHVAFRGR